MELCSEHHGVQRTQDIGDTYVVLQKLLADDEVRILCAAVIDVCVVFPTREAEE